MENKVVNEKSLLKKLVERQIDLEDMTAINREFISSYFGSSSVDGGHVCYTPRQLEVLFASVPRIFPYGWRYNGELTEKQSAVLEIIHEVEPHPQYTMTFDKIPRIISAASFYAERSFRELQQLKLAK